MARLVATQAPVNRRVLVVVAYTQTAYRANFIFQSALNVGIFTNGLLLLTVVLVVHAHQRISVPLHCSRAAGAKWFSSRFTVAVVNARLAEITIAQAKD